MLRRLVFNGFDIDCRILGTVLCWNGRSDCLLHRFDVRPYGDWGLSLPLHSGGKEQRDSVSKEHWTVESDSDHTEHWTLHGDCEHKDYWTLKCDSDQHVTQQAMLSVCALKVNVLWAAEICQNSLHSLPVVVRKGDVTRMYVAVI